MKKLFITIGICAFLAPLSACLHNAQPSVPENAFWNEADQNEMLTFRRSMRNTNLESQKDKSLQNKLVFQSPENLAEKAIASGDYRLLSLEMGYRGYMASDQDATEPFLIKCGQNVPTQPIVYGCVPPPPFMFKVLARYNDRILAATSFPHKDICQVDKETREQFITWEKEHLRHTEDKSR